MQKVWFALYFPLLKLLSLLPMRVLYILSDILYFFLFKIFKYRKKVVLDNLNNSFPEKNQTEINEICRKYYSHLSDIIVESLKTFSISKKEILERVYFPNDFIEKDFGSLRSVFFLLGHSGNWEWPGLASSLRFDAKTHIVYHSLSNEPFDILMQETRSKFGALLSNMNQVGRNMILFKKDITLTCLVADQSPNPNGAYWTDFLNQKTAFFRGPAKLSQKFSYPLYYFSCSKPSRGKYDFEPKLIVKNPLEVTEDEILELYIRCLEKDIQENPHLWLWSHKRWKHKYQEKN